MGRKRTALPFTAEHPGEEKRKSWDIFTFRTDNRAAEKESAALKIERPYKVRPGTSRENALLLKNFCGFLHDFTDGKVLRAVIFAGFAGNTVAGPASLCEPDRIISL